MISHAPRDKNGAVEEILSKRYDQPKRFRVLKLTFIVLTIFTKKYISYFVNYSNAQVILSRNRTANLYLFSSSICGSFLFVLGLAPRFGRLWYTAEPGALATFGALTRRTSRNICVPDVVCTNEKI